jgi:hypothetical protein
VILEHSQDPVSAKWDKDLNKWNVGNKKKYRWCNTKNKPESDWFYNITDALQWIIQYETNRLSNG